MHSSQEDQGGSLCQYQSESVEKQNQQDIRISLFQYIYTYISARASLVAQTVKNLPTIWETQVLSLGREDPLEKGIATHSSILAWKISWTEEPGGLPSIGLQRVKPD